MSNPARIRPTIVDSREAAQHGVTPVGRRCDRERPRVSTSGYTDRGDLMFRHVNSIRTASASRGRGNAGGGRARIDGCDAILPGRYFFCFAIT